MIILFQDIDSRLGTMYPIEAGRLPGESDETFCRRIAAKDVPLAMLPGETLAAYQKRNDNRTPDMELVPWRLAEESELPADQTYRDAWFYTDDGIGLDQVKKNAIDAAIAKGVIPS